MRGAGIPSLRPPSSDVDGRLRLKKFNKTTTRARYNVSWKTGTSIETQ
jgi:hypothetical protein